MAVPSAGGPEAELSAASGEPALSVVLVTDRYDTVRVVVEHLRAQSARERLELVLVIPAGASLPAEAEPAGFARTRIVQLGSLSPLAEAYAAGVRAASGRAVFIGETHSYPAPDWAEKLIAAQEESWTVVVPALGNANPGGALSWAAFVLDYGFWAGGPRRELDRIPVHNFAFARAPLMELGPRMRELFEPGSVLPAALRKRGHRFLLEPAGRIEHVNISVLRHWLRERFLVGRRFGWTRAAAWSWPRKLAYSAGSPLIPPLIIWRIVRDVRPNVRQHALPHLLFPAIGLGAAAWALGEVLGYLLGTDERVVEALEEYELFKNAYAPRPAVR
jgi:hypothetical protein